MDLVLDSSHDGPGIVTDEGRMYVRITIERTIYRELSIDQNGKPVWVELSTPRKVRLLRICELRRGNSFGRWLLWPCRGGGALRSYPTPGAAANAHPAFREKIYSYVPSD